MQRTSEILFRLWEHKIHIFELTNNVLLLYRHNDDCVLRIFRRFLTSFLRFPKVLKNLFEGHTNRDEHFPKITEVFQRLPNITEDFRGRPEDVSIIHQRIWVQFEETNLVISVIIDIFTAENMVAWISAASSAGENALGENAVRWRHESKVVICEISHVTFSAKACRQSFGGRQSSPPLYRQFAKFTKKKRVFAAVHS